MLVVPSPQMLNHYKSEHFGKQILYIEFSSQNENQDDYRNFSQLILDMNLAYSPNRVTSSPKQQMYTTSLLCQFSLFDSPAKSIYLALVALRNNSQYSAIKYLIEAAQDGSPDAMNLLGKIYEQKQIDSDFAFKWYSRAYRLGSISSLSNLGYYFLNNNDKIKSMYFLKKYHEKTNNIFSILTIAQIFQKMNNKELSMKLYRYCAANGIQDAVEQMTIEISSLGSAYQELFQWLSIGTRYNIINKSSSSIQHCELLKANYNSDFSIPPISSINKRMQPPEPFVQTSKTKNLVQRNESVINEGIWQPDKPRKKDDSNKMKSLYFFPNESNTSLLLLALHYCSKNQGKRNLLYAKSILKKLQFKTKFGLFNSKIWLSKIKSKNPTDLMKCGFVCCLLNDFSSAYSLFLSSSNLGNRVSTLMCGIINYHGLMNDNDRKAQLGFFFFSSCPLDPIALLYVGMATENDEWIERAAQILQVDSKSGKMFEDLGDFFFEGVKLPRIVNAATIWYTVAFKYYEKYGFDTKKIIKKLSCSSFDEMSAS